MAETPKVFVICDKNCKFEGMTKEQILTAIMQAASSGIITDVDAGFITTIKTINGLPLRFFVGEQSEYLALTAEQKKGLFAIITNDTAKAGFEEAIREISTELTELIEKLLSGELTVAKATEADKATEAEKANGDEGGYNFRDNYFCINVWDGYNYSGDAKTGVDIYGRKRKCGNAFIVNWKDTGRIICFGVMFWGGSETAPTYSAVTNQYSGKRYAVKIEPTVEEAFDDTKPEETFIKGKAKIVQFDENGAESDLSLSGTTWLEFRSLTDNYFINE